MKKILTWLFGLLIVLTAIVLIRAHTAFEDKQYAVTEPLNVISFDEAIAVERFAKGIQFKTISYEDPDKFKPQEFDGLIKHIEISFPLVHQHMEHKRVNNYSLVFKLPGSNPGLKPALFMGHTDVVPVDIITRRDWEQEPFSGAVVDGVIWGRGAMDDKVTVFALLEAMENLLASNLKAERTIYFAFGHDEEIGGPEGAAAIAKDFTDQGIEFEFVLDEGGAISEGMIAGINQPVAIIGVAEKGYANLRLTVKDIGGHSSQAPDHTAAGILSQAIVNLENNQFPASLKFTQFTFDKIGYYTDLKVRLPMANLWLFAPLVKNTMLKNPSSAASIRTTTAATMLQGSSKSNILPTEAVATVNFRLFPGDSVADLVEHAQRVIDNPRVEIEPYMANEASNVSNTDSYGYKLIEQTIRRVDSNVLVAPYLVPGGTDAKHFTHLSDSINRFMFVRITPDLLNRIHGLNEQIPVEDYITAVQFFASIIEQAASGN